MPTGSFHFQVGTISCTVLADGYASYPPAWFFPNAEPDRLARALAVHGLPQERILSPYTCLLIQTGRRNILVDTGGGPAAPASGAIPARLEMAGIRCQDVDTVLLTHAHPDHIGGAIDAQGRSLFPKACY